MLGSSLLIEEHMQTADSCFDSPEMDYSGIQNVNGEKGHDMCDNNREKEHYVVRKVVCVLGESAKEWCIGMHRCIGMVALLNGKEKLINLRDHFQI